MDSFADSFLKGWAINQQDEAMKRQKDAAQLQQLVQVMQFQKMAADLQRQAGLEQALASPEVQKQLGPNSGAITALVRAGNHDALTKALFPTEPRTLENILAEKVRTGEMTLQDAITFKNKEKPRQLKGFEKTTQKAIRENPNTGSLEYDDGTPYRGGQLTPITEPAPTFGLVGSSSTPGKAFRLNTKSGQIEEVPIPGGGRIQPTTEPSVTAESAAKLELVKQGASDVREAFKMLFGKDGKVDRRLLAEAGTNAPFSRGRTFNSFIYNAVEGKLRAETGATAPDTEVKRAAKRFMPTFLDDANTIRVKLERLHDYLTKTGKIMDPYSRLDKDVPQTNLPAAEVTVPPGTNVTPENAEQHFKNGIKKPTIGYRFDPQTGTLIPVK